MREMEDSESEELLMEVESLKKTVASARDESKAKDRKMANLEAELGRMRQGEADKDASLGQLMKELRELREESKAQELERELERKTMAESSMARQLDSAMFELEESKIEIASLHEKIDGLEDLCHRIGKEATDNEEVRDLKSKLLKAQEAETRAVSKAESLADEMEVLKGEWKFSMEGEDKSSKAMEDLAMALKEVATESNKAKMELIAKEAEVERMKEELAEAKAAAERLRAETEETLLAWNAKEIGFMSCIKRAEEERALAQIESHKSAESLKAAENMTRSAQEETYKLQDILKQAINESNAAKAASGLVRDENSLLKDCLAEKEEALHFTSQENERLRISKAAAQEHVKQLKQMLTLASADIKIDDKDEIGFVMFTDSGHDGNEGEDRKYSFDMDEVQFINEAEDGDEDEDEDPEKAEALRGSIFDTSVETPKTEARTPKATFFRLKSTKSTSTSSPLGDEHDEADGEGDKQHEHEHGPRRSKTMFQRVGGLLTIRNSFHRKEPSIDQKTTPTQTQQPSQV
ncbi:WEB family protein At3g02930, chloroplastic-like isoform X2 [Salvia splendens]|nr:WEB family protein At3g02930, chloroplastic-like isoform X2 [Salvia splendens]